MKLRKKEILPLLVWAQSYLVGVGLSFFIPELLLSQGAEEINSEEVYSEEGADLLTGSRSHPLGPVVVKNRSGKDFWFFTGSDLTWRYISRVKGAKKWDSAKSVEWKSKSVKTPEILRENGQSVDFDFDWVQTPVDRLIVTLSPNNITFETYSLIFNLHTEKVEFFGPVTEADPIAREMYASEDSSIAVPVTDSVVMDTSYTQKIRIPYMKTSKSAEGVYSFQTYETIFDGKRWLSPRPIAPTDGVSHLLDNFEIEVQSTLASRILGQDRLAVATIFKLKEGATDLRGPYVMTLHERDWVSGESKVLNIAENFTKSLPDEYKNFLHFIHPSFAYDSLQEVLTMRVSSRSSNDDEGILTWTLKPQLGEAFHFASEKLSQRSWPKKTGYYQTKVRDTVLVESKVPGVHKVGIIRANAKIDWSTTNHLSTTEGLRREDDSEAFKIGPTHWAWIRTSTWDRVENGESLGFKGLRLSVLDEGSHKVETWILNEYVEDEPPVTSPAPWATVRMNKDSKTLSVFFATRSVQAATEPREVKFFEKTLKMK